MRYVGLLLAGLFLLALTGCGSMNPFPKHVYSTPPPESSRPGQKTYDPKTRPYTVMGKTYYPLKDARGYDEVGMASWYGDDFHGKKNSQWSTV